MTCACEFGKRCPWHGEAVVATVGEIVRWRGADLECVFDGRQSLLPEDRPSGQSSLHALTQRKILKGSAKHVVQTEGWLKKQGKRRA